MTVKKHRRPCTRAQEPCAHSSINGWMGRVGQVVCISCSVHRGVFFRQFFSPKNLSGTADLRCGEVKYWSIQPTSEHSSIYAKTSVQLLGARAWAAICLDRGCTRTTNNSNIKMRSSTRQSSKKLENNLETWDSGNYEQNGRTCWPPPPPPRRMTFFNSS